MTQPERRARSSARQTDRRITQGKGLVIRRKVRVIGNDSMERKVRGSARQTETQTEE
jgi:hypothetical protein